MQKIIPRFKHNPSISFMASCNAAEEVNRLWDALKDGGTPLMDVGTYDFQNDMDGFKINLVCHGRLCQK